VTVAWQIGEFGRSLPFFKLPSVLSEDFRKNMNIIQGSLNRFELRGFPLHA
jgi:hypothetical protein